MEIQERSIEDADNELEELHDTVVDVMNDETRPYMR